MPLGLNTLTDLLIYIYSDTHDHINQETALQLIANAGYLSLTHGVRHRRLLHHCCDLISATLTTNNCLAILLDLEDVDPFLDELRERILNFIVSQYEVVAITDEFSRLPQHLINKINITVNLSLLQRLKKYEQRNF